MPNKPKVGNVERFLEMKIPMTKKLFIIIILLAVGIISNSVQAATKLSLSDAIDKALGQNHDVQMALNNKRIANNNVNIGNAGLLPKIDFVSTANFTDQDLAAGSNPSSTQNNAEIQASLTLFNGFSNIYSFKKLQKSKQLEELTTRATIESIVISVSQAYYDLASAQEQLLIAEEAISISNDRYQRAERQADYGQANAVDVLSALVDLNTDSTNFLNASLELDQTRRNLSVLLNAGLQSKFNVETEVEFIEPPDLVSMQKNALNTNANYLISLTSKERAELDLNIARSNYWPKLNLQSSYGYNQTASDFNIDYGDPNRRFTVGLTLSLNLFNGFQDKIKTSNAKIAVKNQQINYNKAKLDLERDVANAFDAYQNTQTILALQQRNLESAELNFQRTEQLFNLGQVTSTTFREAQLNLIRSRNSISLAKYSSKLAEFKLLQLAGDLLDQRDSTL